MCVNGIYMGCLIVNGATGPLTPLGEQYQPNGWAGICTGHGNSHARYFHVLFYYLSIVVATSSIG